MIGKWAILLNLILLIPMGGFALAAAETLRSARWWRHLPSVGFLVFVFFLELSFFGHMTVSGFNLLYMKTLSANKVASITVGGRTISDREAIESVVGALRQSQWFLNNHGGWADEVEMRINMEDGGEKSFQVAFYLRKPGAVMLKRVSVGRAYTIIEFGFSAALPDALSDAHTSLPIAGRLRGQ